MALDNANFIAELSITDPPGTDPLAQGDDQIRTVKRATQQSFPFIDKQVDLTADQLNEAAIKNESNVFTVKQTIANELDLTMASAVGDSVKVNFLDFSNQQVRWYFTEVPEDALNPLAFGLIRNDSAGAFASAPWICDPVTGVIDFDHVPTINGDPIWTAGEIKLLVQGASLPSTNWFLCNGTQGTVALQDRILGAQGVFTGTQTPFLDVQTDVGPITGSTAISTAQMPAHHHAFSMGDFSGGVIPLGDPAGIVTYGLQNPITNLRFSDNSGGGNRMIDDTGGGAGHTHTIPELECNPASNDAFQVMPFTYFFQVIQYVP